MNLPALVAVVIATHVMCAATCYSLGRRYGNGATMRALMRLAPPPPPPPREPRRSRIAA